MIEIKLEEASSLTMEMKIDGDVKGDTQLRFTVLDEGVRYSFESKPTMGDVYEIAFPVMEGKIAAGEYQAQVEIMVDGKYFVPLQETVKFTKEVKPVVKLAEQMKRLEQPVQVKIGSVAKTTPLKKITDVRGLIGSLTEGEEIDTEFAIRALNGLALNESVVLGSVKIEPSRALAEAEAIAALRLIRENGSDIEAKEAIWEGIGAMSPKVSSELRTVLSEKGVSARVLKSFGF